MMSIAEATAIATLATLLGVIGVGVKIVRHLTRMEMKVDLMWVEFVRRFGSEEQP